MKRYRYKLLRERIGFDLSKIDRDAQEEYHDLVSNWEHYSGGKNQVNHPFHILEDFIFRFDRSHGLTCEKLQAIVDKFGLDVDFDPETIGVQSEFALDKPLSKKESDSFLREIIEALNNSRIIGKIEKSIRIKTLPEYPILYYFIDYNKDSDFIEIFMVVKKIG